MHRSASVIFAFTALLVCPAIAQDQRIGKPPNVVFNQIIEGMPKADKQQVRVLVGTFNPGDRTVSHTHRFPVTVYVMQGAFTLKMQGRQTVTVKSGEAFVEPPNVKITGYNRSRTERMKAVVFYVSNPDTPFLNLTR
jgi:quercetin dioxygenase-like cupin family protein